MKKLLISFSFLLIGGVISAQEGLKKAQKAEGVAVEYHKANKATEVQTSSFKEEEFIEEYLIGNELPQSFPDRSQYVDEKSFMRDVKMWVMENPELVYEYKRIK